MESLALQVNGKAASLEAPDPSALNHVLTLLDLRADRIAVELNGSIVPRTDWDSTLVQGGDRLEIVHFVGGGAGPIA
jgi:sulfur carrier protein